MTRAAASASTMPDYLVRTIATSLSGVAVLLGLLVLSSGQNAPAPLTRTGMTVAIQDLPPDASHHHIIAKPIRLAVATAPPASQPMAAPEPASVKPPLSITSAPKATNKPAVPPGTRLVHAGRIEKHVMVGSDLPIKPASFPVAANNQHLRAPAPDHLPAWQRYAIASSAPSSQPRIAIVIDDLGLSASRTERAIALPGPLTMSFLPYGHDLPMLARLAHANGHELLVHMPMEPISAKQDPGPRALLTALSDQENLRRLRHNLGQFSGYVGINNHMGSKFTSETNKMLPVLRELQQRGLMFLDSQTSGQSVAGELSESLGMPTARRSVFIDHDQSPAAVEAALKQLEATARHYGSAVGIGHPHRITMEALQRWLPTLAERGIALVPISRIARDHLSQDQIAQVGVNP